MTLQVLAEAKLFLKVSQTFFLILSLPIPAQALSADSSIPYQVLFACVQSDSCLLGLL